MSSGFAIGFVDELMEQEASNHIQSFEYSSAFTGAAGKSGNFNVAIVEQKIHVLDRSGIGQVALVELQHVRDVRQIEIEALEILFEIGEALDVLSHFFVLRIGHKDDPVHPAQDELAGGVVDDLPRHGIKLELGFEPLDRHRLDGQEVKKERPIRTRGEGNQFAFVALGGLNVIVDLHQVGSLAAQGRPVIDDFNLEFFVCLVDDRHRYFLPGVPADFFRDEMKFWHGQGNASLA